MSEHKSSSVLFALLGALIAIGVLYAIGVVVIDAFGANDLVENSEFNPATMWKFLLLLMPLAVVRAAVLVWRQRSLAAKRPQREK